MKNVKNNKKTPRKNETSLQSRTGSERSNTGDDAMESSSINRNHNHSFDHDGDDYTVPRPTLRHLMPNPEGRFFDGSGCSGSSYHSHHGSSRLVGLFSLETLQAMRTTDYIGYGNDSSLSTDQILNQALEIANDIDRLLNASRRKQ